MILVSGRYCTKSCCAFCIWFLPGLVNGLALTTFGVYIFKGLLYTEPLFGAIFSPISGRLLKIGLNLEESPFGKGILLWTDELSLLVFGLYELGRDGFIFSLPMPLALPSGYDASSSL